MEALRGRRKKILPKIPNEPNKPRKAEKKHICNYQNV
jgi:hypothetical protein